MANSRKIAARFTGSRQFNRFALVDRKKPAPSLCALGCLGKVSKTIFLISWEIHLVKATRLAVSGASSLLSNQPSACAIEGEVDEHITSSDGRDLDGKGAAS
jgi:hypothetical protein